MQERLKTAQEIAEYLQIPLSGIYDMTHRKKGIPFLKIGTRLRFRQSDVEEWLQSQTVSGKSEIDVPK
jgi:excisionase family DNA binding protein